MTKGVRPYLRKAWHEYDEVERRYTNPDGTRRAGWMKAPNGRPTNLTERQWVQVRTPAVKRDLSDLGRHLYDPKGLKPKSYMAEGFAEYVRGYVVNAQNWNDSNSVILHGMRKSSIADLLHWQDEFRQLKRTSDPQTRARLAASISDKVESAPYIFTTTVRETSDPLDSDKKSPNPVKPP